MKKEHLDIETVHQCNCRMGCTTLHPQASVIDLSKADLAQCTIQCDFYTIILAEGNAGKPAYGRKYYDYSDATLIFHTPRASIQPDLNNLSDQAGSILVFHPDLIAYTSLGSHIKDYSFFFYQPNESLHLSLREKMKIAACIRQIEEELQYPIDRHSKILISRHIELLLDYCARFYERQFITRCDANRRLLRKTELLLNEYILSDRLRKGILPTEEYCATILRLSPCYFRDLLRFETGKTLNEYFQLLRLNTAKKMLQDNHTVDATAERLGYASAQHFALLFKKVTGISPTAYKRMQN